MIFLDTGFLYSLFCRSEVTHKCARNIYDYFSEDKSIKVINSVVLVEILNKSRKLNLFPNELFDILNNNTLIVFLSESDFFDALKLNQDYGNAINYSDCTILKTMIDLGINRIVSFDSDFDKIKGIERIH